MAGIEALKTYRKEHDLSLDALAQKIGVSAATLSRWEHGQRSPKPSLLRRIQEATGIPPIDLRPDLAELLSEAGE